MGDEAGRAVARAAAVERRGRRRRGAPAVPAGRDTPAVPAGSGAPAVPAGSGAPAVPFLMGWREEQQGEEGGKGEGGEHPLFVPG